MALFKKIFDHEYKELEKFKKQAMEVDALSDEMSKLTDKELKKAGYTKTDMQELAVKAAEETKAKPLIL